ncbi:rod shape-determining protein MreC [Brevibacillus composti]|uniref:Cell shape-determining protein MreC n=1 Tax=Brevibacillus composti TaxID=2796470 RepID=A0A7T5EIS6_9BACL|nr:rod shape-determining protein MreC [Brevibacillus composti]QQE73295.1 rod shape-determining protein MreC [Brevibacillus composti]QUO40376.1 rod shape-determining protein MreC [Brevibacillus composti]
MSFFGNKRLIIVLVGLVLLITIVGFTSRERSKLSWPEMFVKDTFSLMQGLLYRPAQAVSGFFQGVGDAYSVYEENRALKASLDQYVRTTAELHDLKAENDRLREALEAKESLVKSYQLRFAEVVARNPDTWNNTITIDMGQKHGIKKDMAVMTAKGLIGRVQSVSNFSSTVELLTSYERRNHISAYIQVQVPNPSGGIMYQTVSGVIEEYDPQERLLVMRKIAWGQKIEANQQVVSSGLGGVIPRNLPIGYIVKAEPDDYGLTQTAYIQPSADFSQLNEVMVVERGFTFSPAGELVPTGQPTQTPGGGQ